MTTIIISEKEARFLGAQIKFGKIKIKGKGTLLDAHGSGISEVIYLSLPFIRIICNLVIAFPLNNTFFEETVL